MDRRLTVVTRPLIVGLVVAGMAPLLGQQKPQIPLGARVMIVAVRDAHLLTICPVAGKDLLVRETSNASSKLSWPSDVRPDIKATVIVDSAHDRLLVAILDPAWLRAEGATHASVTLPLSPSFRATVFEPWLGRSTAAGRHRV